MTKNGFVPEVNFKFSINEVSVEVHKIIKFTIYNTVYIIYCSFASGEGVGEVVVN